MPLTLDWTGLSLGIWATANGLKIFRTAAIRTGLTVNIRVADNRSFSNGLE